VVWRSAGCFEFDDPTGIWGGDVGDNLPLPGKPGFFSSGSGTSNSAANPLWTCNQPSQRYRDNTPPPPPQLPVSAQPPAPPQPIVSAQQPVAREAPAASQRTRSGRAVNPPQRYGLREEEEQAHIPLMDAPKSYRQAITAPDAENWTLAIGKEIAALEANDTWDVLDIPDLPKDKTILDNTWIFRYMYKADGTVERFKARLVARGDLQDPTFGDYNELFAPVVRFDSLSILVAISASRKWRPRQLDVKTAFLYGHLKEEIYMHLPPGSRIDGKVCKLKRCL
jgi:uncharacterized protein (DUF1330 family)